MTRTLLLAVLLGASAVAHAQYADDESPQLSEAELALEDAYLAAGRGYGERVADALATTGDARELAFAARLHDIAGEPPPNQPHPLGDAPSQRVGADSKAAAWRRIAAGKAGDDILANQLLIDAAVGTDAALRAHAIARWREAEPQNLMPMLWQQWPAETLLQQARQASHAETHMYEGIRWMASVYQRHPPTVAEQRMLAGEGPFHADEFAALSAMGIWAAVSMPVLQPLMEACRGDALRASPARREDCRHVGSILADRSDALILRHAGLGLLRETASDTYERSDIAARQRRMDWQMQAWGEVARDQEREGAAQFARLLADTSIRTEQQMVERVLQEAGVSLEPPAGWQSPWR